MKNQLKHFIVLFSGLFFLAQLPCFSQPVSDFSIDAESWGTVGKCPAESSPGVTYSASGGNPGGCIRGTDNSIGVWYFFGGGSEWKGNLSAYYGCDLLFDLKTNDDGWPVGSQYDVLIIKGDDYTISYNSSPNPGEVWTSYVVPLVEGSWILDGLLDAANCPDLAGSLATAADMITYLSDIKRLRIRAEFGGLNSETNYMDNVMIVCDILLPVGLTEFSAEALGHNVSLLSWNTSTETDCAGFELQKSINGVTFNSIGYVEGNGTTTSEHNYEFEDDNFITTSYYRLKQIDLNGDFVYSNIISLTCTEALDPVTHIYPNPTSDFINIISNNSSPMVSIVISDATGHMVYQEYTDNFSGSMQKQILLDNCRSGIYLATINRLSGSETLIFEVIK
ncbi:MAG: T9SS type A sorting domain-containing protein [Chitinophagales bacterium]